MADAFDGEREEAPGMIRRALGRWQAIPLYLRIVIALAAGVVAGLIAGQKGIYLALPARVILKLLGAIAPPLVLLAVMNALMTTRIGASTAGKLARLLALNTFVAICFGLLVANVVQPGRRAPALHPHAAQAAGEKDALARVIDAIPESLLTPLLKNDVLWVIVLGVAFGVALRSDATRPVRTIADVVETAYRAIVRVLNWVIALVPLAVFGVVAGIVGKEGFRPFVALAWFIGAVLLGLFLQGIWYLTRIRFGCWTSPMRVIRGTRDALAMAFSTDSSTATMPVTYGCLVEQVGLRPKSASLGALVGTNFNNDGTALYEAMSALFIAQLTGQHLTLGQQLLVMLTSIVASVGAAGIPEAGVVTMTLVLTAVKLPTDYIALLLTVDWFLDRSRTVINVMGDINVSCLLEGRKKSLDEGPSAARVPAGAVEEVMSEI